MGGWILDLGPSWRVVSFTPLPLYPRGKSPRYPLDRRLGGPQRQSGQSGEVKILAPTWTQTPTLCLQPVASRYADYAVPALTCVCVSGGLPEVKKVGREGGQREERYGAG
jgi:hypothetical protein